MLNKSIPQKNRMIIDKIVMTPNLRNSWVHKSYKNTSNECLGTLLVWFDGLLMIKTIVIAISRKILKNVRFHSSNNKSVGAWWGSKFSI